MSLASPVARVGVIALFCMLCGACAPEGTPEPDVRPPAQLGKPAALTARAAAKLDRLLRDLHAGDTGQGKRADAELSGIALAVLDAGEIVYQGASGFAQLPHGPDESGQPLTAHTKMRVASVSKLAVALGVAALAGEGRMALDGDVSQWLGWELRTPAQPGTPITVRHLISHTSTLVDPPAYWVALPRHLSELFEATPALFSQTTARPGERFHYANINYGVLAGAMERASGMRFDRLVQEKVLKPLGIADAGFNWSGVSRAARSNAATLYRRVDGRWQAQVDNGDVLAGNGPLVLAHDGAQLADYVPGSNGSLFSPQGGLRASVVDMAMLAGGLAGRVAQAAALTDPVWVFDSRLANGDTDGGFILEFGSGVHIVRQFASHWQGRPLLGHAGEAYGLIAGAWLVAGSKLSFAYAITGTDGNTEIPRDPETGFMPWSKALIEAVARFAASRLRSDPALLDRVTLL